MEVMEVMEAVCGGQARRLLLSLQLLVCRFLSNYVPDLNSTKQK